MSGFAGRPLASLTGRPEASYGARGENFPNLFARTTVVLRWRSKRPGPSAPVLTRPQSRLRTLGRAGEKLGSVNQLGQCKRAAVRPEHGGRRLLSGGHPEIFPRQRSGLGRRRSDGQHSDGDTHPRRRPFRCLAGRNHRAKGRRRRLLQADERQQQRAPRECTRPRVRKRSGHPEPGDRSRPATSPYPTAAGASRTFGFRATADRGSSTRKINSSRLRNGR